MKIDGIWIVELPIKLNIGNKFKSTPLTQFCFELDNIKYELLKNKDKNYIDKLKISFSEEYDDKYAYLEGYNEYLDDFIDRISYRISKIAQRFMDGFSKAIHGEYYQIWDGKDFATNYEFQISPGILSGGFSQGIISSDDIYNFDDDIFNKSIAFTLKDNGVLDNAWFFYRDAEHMADIGRFDLSILNMAMMFEFLVKYILRDYLDENGRYIDDTHRENIKSLFGKSATFKERYFDYGLHLVTTQLLPKSLLDSIDFIYKVRNKLAHGKRLEEINYIKEVGIEEYKIKDFFHDLLNDTVEVYNYFFDLINNMS